MWLQTLALVAMGAVVPKQTLDTPVTAPWHAAIFNLLGVTRGDGRVTPADAAADTSAEWSRLSTTPSATPVYAKRGEVIVRFSHGFERTGLDAMELHLGHGPHRLYQQVMVFHHDPQESFQAVRERLMQIRGVRDVEPNVVLFLASGWATRDLRTTQDSLQDVRGGWRPHRAHGPTHPIQVGILDTGIDAEHPDLFGAVSTGVNLLYQEAAGQAPAADATQEDLDPTAMDYNGHGTGIAGIIGAKHNDFGIDGIAGMGDQVTLVPIKAFSQGGVGTLADVLRGVHWAMDHHVDVLNLSFGTYAPSTLLADLMRDAQDAGIVVVAAGGNDAADTVTYPAALPGVVAVGNATDHDISPTSNVGARLDVFAPGDAIMSTTSTWVQANPYAPMSGTSAAAAHVSGVLALIVAHGETPAAARRFLLAHTTARQGSGGGYRTVNAALAMADLFHVKRRDIAITAMQMPRWIGPTAPAPLHYTITNTGNQPLASQPLVLHWVEGSQHGTHTVATVPALAAGAVTRGTVDVTLPPPGLARARAFRDIAVSLEVGAVPAPHSKRTVYTTATHRPVIQVGVRRAALRPMGPLAAVRTVELLLRNDGTTPTGPLRCNAWTFPGSGEGALLAPRHPLTTPVSLANLAVGEERAISLPVLGASDDTEAFTLLVEVVQPAADDDATVVGQATQTYDIPASGQLTLSYSPTTHMGSVEAAVQLLRDNGVYLGDVHEAEALYLGSPAARHPWGNAAKVGIGRHAWDWQTDWDLYPADHKTLLDGASSADGVDVAFGDTGIATWNTHFWVVDENDHAGLGKHSALDKLYALMLGGQGSSITDGAIAAYNRGDHAKAWWLLGHAAHLIGDVSTGCHTLNRNIHGVVGDPFHDWMGRDEHFRAWPASVAQAAGGVIDPYRPELADTAARLRFLLYTTAQIGSAFPWHRTRLVPSPLPTSADGNRVLGGDAPHYEAYLAPLMAALPTHPLTARDLIRDEVVDGKQVCQQARSVGRADHRADCWDGGDNHIDYNNAAKATADMDGDLAVIADNSYVYAVRAVAGLLYLFAVETGQTAPLPL